jgi:hypothetical protein
MRISDLENANGLEKFISQIDNMLTELGRGNVPVDMGASSATTIVAGVDVHYKPATAAIKPGYDHLLEMVSKGSLPPSISDLPGDSSTSITLASQYREAMATACMNRAFFITGSAHFGLEPYFAIQDDIFGVLYGSQFPVVLRPMGKDFLFLGTCYVHGIVYGKTSHRSHEDEVTFSLR